MEFVTGFQCRLFASWLIGSCAGQNVLTWRESQALNCKMHTSSDLLVWFVILHIIISWLKFSHSDRALI